MLTAGVSCAAILRAGGRVFIGWGPPTDPLLSPEPPEHEREGREVPLLLMRATTVGLLVAGLALSAVPGLERRAEVAAERFQDRPLYVRTVLFGHELPPVPRPPVALVEPPAESALYGLGAVALAVGIATVALRRRRRRPRALPRPVGLLRAVHSGHIGDYVAWLTAGTATMGVLFAFLLR
jgi:multicomponent Na+:H+ antiporter subunit D